MGSGSREHALAAGTDVNFALFAASGGLWGGHLPWVDMHTTKNVLLERRRRLPPKEAYDSRLFLTEKSIAYTRVDSGARGPSDKLTPWR